MQTSQFILERSLTSDYPVATEHQISGTEKHMLLKSIDSDPPSLHPCLPPSIPPSLPPSHPLQGYESDLLSFSLLAEEYAPIPDPQHTSATPTVVADYQFSCNTTAVYPHTTVGSGGW